MEFEFLNPQDKGSETLTSNVILIWLAIKSCLGNGGQKCCPTLNGTAPRQRSRTIHCMEASADHSGKPLRRSGTRLWGIAEEVAGTFTSAGLRNLRSSEEGIFVWD